MTTSSAPEPTPYTSVDQYVGDRVAFEMRRRRLSQEAVAGHLGMGQSNLSKKLNGTRGWSLDEVLAASRYFSVPVEELMTPDVDYIPAPMREDRLTEIEERIQQKLLDVQETPDRSAPGGGSTFVLSDFNDLRACRDSNPKPSDLYPIAPVVPIVAARSARWTRSAGVAGTCKPLDGRLATVYALARREVSA